ncbi:hypothetical protein IAT40_000604 [Kwoniella sp. CBS 6097]
MGASDDRHSKFVEGDVSTNASPPAYTEKTSRKSKYDPNVEYYGGEGSPRSSQETAVESYPREVGADGDQTAADRAREEDDDKTFWQRCKDKWAFVAFLTNLALYNILACYAIYSFMTDYKEELDDLSELKVEGNDELSKALTGENIWMFIGATGLGLGLSFALLFFVRFFPAIVIWSGPVLCTIMLFAAAGVWSFAIGCAFAGAILLASLWFLKGRYYLARDLLDTANRAARAHWSVFWTVMIGLLASGIHSIWNVFAFISVYLRFAPGHRACKDGYCSAQVTLMLLAYIVVSHIWISGVISNITILTMAGGPYAQWWKGTDRTDKSESWWAFKKAVGTSLGSVAFGSLLVTAIEVFAFVVRVLTGELFGYGWCSCCCSWLLHWIEKMMEYFNKYVYIKIGVEGFAFGYRRAAGETLRFFRGKNRKDRTGLTAILGDSIVGLAMHTMCIANALLAAALTWVYTTMVDGTAKVDDWWDWLILLYSFILALNVGLVLTSALEAGVSTIIVCLDHSPEHLKRRNPGFYNNLTSNKRFAKYKSLLEERADNRK